MTKFKTNKNLGFGLGLRSGHFNSVLNGHVQTAQWFEVISENYMGTGGRPLYNITKVRQNYPLVMHGVSLSIGSTDPLNKNYLKSLKQLVSVLEPAWVSDHICWTGVEGQNLHDLLPLPYTEATIQHVCRRIDEVQNFLGQKMVFENVSSYLTYAQSEMSEWDFISEISRRTGCGLLLDVNNIYVSSVNHLFDPMDYINGVPADAIEQIHLAGHSTYKTEAGDCYLVDTHDHPVCKQVWDLYEQAIKLFGKVPTMIERDAKIPSFEELELELNTAKQITEKVTTSPKYEQYTPRTASADAQRHH